MGSTRVDKAEIIKRTDSTSVGGPDLLAVEEPLEIRLGFGAESNRMQKTISVTMRTPGHDFELALGFLYTENIISSYSDVLSIRYCADVDKQDEKENIVRVELHPDVKIEIKRIERHFYTSSSCGVCGKTSIEAVKVGCKMISSDLEIPEHVLHNSPAVMRKQQQVFEYTGGLHAAALFDAAGDLVLMREDIGRHNAVDKLVGACLVQEKLPLDNLFILVSGRAGFELVQKSLMAGIPVMAAIGAPSSLAVSLAKDFGMTLVGFMRNNSFNIYCGKERLKLMQ